jgi:O-antigen ligase
MKSNRLIFFVICFVFIALNTYAISKEIYMVPILSVGVALLYFLFFKVDIVIYLMALVTPVSVFYSFAEGDSLRLSMPSELIMIMLTAIFFCRIIYDLTIDRKLLKHPISIAIYIYLLWLLITSITSELPLVSFKFLISKIWFVVSCYFMLLQLFKQQMRNIVTFFNCYAIGLAVVVFFATYMHAKFGFSERASHWVMSPFYNDHTAYGAILAFFVPFSIGFIFLPENSWKKRLFYIGLSLIFIMGLALSLSRAAWISMIGGIAIFAVIKLKIKFSWLILGGAVLVAGFFYFSDDILYRMSRNEQESSGNITEHIQSITNISTDASNVERLNRWVSAFGMIEERPVVGWGPGTYQFVYAPFQKNQWKTIITTDFGDGGNAHSEYIGPCAETGFVGLFTVLLLFGISLYYGITTYIKSKDKTVKIIVLCATIALITYYIHGILNNFLDTDKLALPFWASYAAILIAWRKEAD